jgi:3-oxoacyl-[acyl-carrier-protein] synthase-1
MKALSASHNDNPQLASRPFDSDRDGFVISGGGGVIVLEEYEHAIARGANIYGELTGYGATSDGFDMVQPSGEGAIRCMHQAMQNNNQVDYLNAHGTSTPVGDMRELEAVREVFGENTPMITSTKSLTGHSLGVAGVHEAIYSILMLNHDFISPSINIDNLDEKAEGFNIVTSLIENAGLETVMSNSFGFGGTNASLVFKKQ